MRWLTISANLTIRELVDTFGAQLGNDVQILQVFYARGVFVYTRLMPVSPNMFRILNNYCTIALAAQVTAIANTQTAKSVSRRMPSAIGRMCVGTRLLHPITNASTTGTSAGYRYRPCV